VSGLDAEAAKQQPFIGSMGIYVFKKDVMVDLLNNKCKGESWSTC